MTIWLKCIIFIKTFPFYLSALGQTRSKFRTSIISRLFSLFGKMLCRNNRQFWKPPVLAMALCTSTSKAQKPWVSPHVGLCSIAIDCVRQARESTVRNYE